MDINKIRGNKGQGIFIGIMIFIMVFIVIVQFISPLKDEITRARAVGSLDCDNSSITTAQKATCIIADWGLFYFFGTALAMAGAYLAGKKMEVI